MTDIELGWLAGIIDGEGTITLCEVHKYDRDNIGYSVNVCISSTDVRITYQAIQLLRTMNLDPALQLMKGKGSRKDAYQVRITNYTEIELLLLQIKDCLVGKQEQAYLMLDYIKQRRLEGRRIGTSSREIAHSIRGLNTKQGE